MTQVAQILRGRLAPAPTARVAAAAPVGWRSVLQQQHRVCSCQRGWMVAGAALQILAAEGALASGRAQWVKAAVEVAAVR